MAGGLFKGNKRCLHHLAYYGQCMRLLGICARGEMSHCRESFVLANTSCTTAMCPVVTVSAMSRQNSDDGAALCRGPAVQ